MWWECSIYMLKKRWVMVLASELKLASTRPRRDVSSRSCAMKRWVSSLHCMNIEEPAAHRVQHSRKARTCEPRNKRHRVHSQSSRKKREATLYVDKPHASALKVSWHNSWMECKHFLILLRASLKPLWGHKARPRVEKKQNKTRRLCFNRKGRSYGERCVGGSRFWTSTRFK